MIYLLFPWLIFPVRYIKLLEGLLHIVGYEPGRLLLLQGLGGGLDSVAPAHDR